MEQAKPAAERIFQNIRKIIHGKDAQVSLVLTCWFAGGHVLIEDNPGTGKTMLARALARSAKVDFNRIQFTPDLLPSDVVGAYVFDQKTSQFRLHKGPVLTTVLLADEINRATPRTQSALLEAMGEGQVTIDGATQVLDPIFFVMATQNPIEQHGTFPLPEAQLDRFMMKISMGYPGPKEEALLVKNQNTVHPIHALEPVVTREDVGRIRAAVTAIRVADAVYDYAVQLVAKTRQCPELKLGASPRATIALVRCAQAAAFIEGLDHVRPSHCLRLLKPVLAHRVMATMDARLAGRTNEAILEDTSKLVTAPIG